MSPGQWHVDCVFVLDRSSLPGAVQPFLDSGQVLQFWSGSTVSGCCAPRHRSVAGLILATMIPSSWSRCYSYHDEMREKRGKKGCSYMNVFLTLSIIIEKISILLAMRLKNHWKKHHPKPGPRAAVPQWRSFRGSRVWLGARLEAESKHWNTALNNQSA